MRIVSIALVAMLAAGCAGTTRTTETAQSRAPQRAPSAQQVQPTAAKDAALGTTLTVKDPAATAKATAYRYRQPLPSTAPPDRKNYTYAGVDARLCLSQISDEPLSVSWDPWSLEYADDTVVTPASAWSDETFRVQLYPGIERRVREGGCVRGWILFEVPKGKRPVRLVYAPDTGSGDPAPPAVWRLH
jgi:hypothetical protein